MLRTRLVVAALGIPALVALVSAPKIVFTVVIILLLAVAACELVCAVAPQARFRSGVLAGAAVIFLILGIHTVGTIRFLVPLPLFAIALGLVLRMSGVPIRIVLYWWISSVIYIGGLGIHWLLLGELSDGRVWVAVGLATTFATDTAAYTVGNLIGRHHLAVTISPRKTWEGAIGGWMGGAAAAFVTIYLLVPGGGMNVTGAVVVLLPLAAICGDLAESAIKRRAGVKDISHILPGHGGLLDRMDSLLFTGPLLYWLLRWLTM